MIQDKNPWEIDWQGQGGDPVIAPADPYKQASDQRAEESLDIQRRRAAAAEAAAQATQTLTQMKIDEKREEKTKDAEMAQKADQAARAKLIATIGKLAQIGTDANDNGGWFETGTSGSFARSVLPSGAAGPTLGRDINTIRARFAFDALQEMRDASKTGGALGQVSELELKLLESAVAALDPDMDHQTFMRNVEEARQAYLSKLAMVDPDAATRMGYDAAAAEQAWLKYNDLYAKELGYGDDVGVNRDFVTQPTGAVPTDIEAIMQKYGAE